MYSHKQQNKLPSQTKTILIWTTLAIGLGLGLGYLITNDSTIDNLKQNNNEPQEQATKQQIKNNFITNKIPTIKTIRDKLPITTNKIQQPKQETSQTNEETNTSTEGIKNNILTRNSTIEEKLKAILDLLAIAPNSEKEELAHHLVNLASDNTFSNATQIMFNTNTPENVCQILLNDTVNRPLNIKLPALLTIAKTTDHPLQQQATAMLQNITKLDYGTDWNSWTKEINNLIEENSP